MMKESFQLAIGFSWAASNDRRNEANQIYYFFFFALINFRVLNLNKHTTTVNRKYRTKSETEWVKERKGYRKWERERVR